MEHFTPPLSGKHIAIIVYNYPLGVSTMILNSIDLLSRHNCIDVYLSNEQQKDQPVSLPLRKLIRPLPDFGGFFVPRLLRFLHKRISRIFRIPAWRWIWWLTNLDIWLLAHWLTANIHPRNYDMVIPIECFSLIATARGFPAGADIVYFNMELLDWSDQNPLYSAKRTLKSLEHEALRQVAHVMITSNNRADIFSEINDYPRNKVSALPVVPMKKNATPRSDYFRTRFGIDNATILVIYAGNLQPWAQCLEIINSMDDWPANSHLVIHTWNPASMKLPYFQKLCAAAKGRKVSFSSDYFNHDALPKVLSSADIGLLFYEAIDANFTEILFSSNKMGEYLAAGLPVICSPFPSLKQFVEEEGIGIACEFDRVGEAIRQISANLPGFRNRVGDCRTRHFEFERYFKSAFGQYARQRGVQTEGEQE